MSEHNFYDSLKEFSDSAPLRLHMPGHKGKPLPMAEWSALVPLDFTELAPTGDLYGGDDWLEDAQRLWAWDWGMDTAIFSTEGSTHGIFTLLALFTRPGDTVLVDRICHKSIHNALALFDLRPIWLERPWDRQTAVSGPLSAESLAEALQNHPEATAVVVTSPTYYGVLTPLEPLAALCRGRGVKLICDGAHGAHLPLVLEGEPNCLLGRNPYVCCDGVTVSAHKTLPAPGQTAVIFADGVRREELQSASALTGTTSPSFAMLAALDRLRPWMRKSGDAWRTTVRRCAALRRDYPCLSPEGLDPCRVTLQVPDGAALYRDLSERGIWAEMADVCHVVCIFTAADTAADFARLRSALDDLGLRHQKLAAADRDAPPCPEVFCTPREARFGRKKALQLSDAAGRVSAACVSPYPPGVPVLAPGERVTEKVVDYLEKLCYDQLGTLLVLED